MGPNSVCFFFFIKNFALINISKCFWLSLKASIDFWLKAQGAQRMIKNYNIKVGPIYLEKVNFCCMLLKFIIKVHYLSVGNTGSITYTLTHF